MALPSIFTLQTTTDCLTRLNKLTPSSQPLWGKMNVAQMLAHLNVSYDIAYGKTVVKNNFFMKLLLKLVIKKIVVSEIPYKQNSQTAPVFIITDARDFEKEKTILINYIKETEVKGAAYFEGKESSSFGILTSGEWSNQFYKHIDHHFKQFGV